MKLMLKIAGGIIIAIVVLTAGCAALIGTAANEATKEKTWQVKIVAPAGKKWSGSVGSTSREGRGSKTLSFKDIAITAVVVQKESSGRWPLRLRLVKDGKTVDTEGTSAQYGVVTVDGSDF
jgi:hypothetical protein